MKLKLYLFLVLLLGVCYQLLITQQLIAPGIAQLVCAILVITLSLKLKVNNQKMHTGLIILTLLITITWFVIVSKKPDLFEAQFYLANFADDLHGKESRKFLQDLNLAWPKDSNVKIYKLNYSVSSYQEAQKLLSKKEKARIIVWGNSNQLNLLIAPPYSINLNDLALTAELNLGLKLVSDVPMIRVFRKPHQATVDFTAGLLAAISKPTELNLRSIGAVSQVWRSSIHLAYLRFKLANYLFLKMLNNSEAWQDASFKCILKEYRRAAFYVRKAEHPELAAAINNNVGLLKYLKVLYNAKKWRKKIPKKFRAISSLKTIKNPLNFPYRALQIAEWNLKLIKQLHNRKKPKKTKHEI